MAEPTCAVCGLGDHRFGTRDRSGRGYDAMACVNMLLSERERLTNEIGQLREAYRRRTDELIAAQAEVDVLRGRDEGNEMVLT